MDIDQTATNGCDEKEMQTKDKDKNAKIIWCNARENAVNFYKKNRYQIIGESFNIKDIGLHYLMYKVL